MKLNKVKTKIMGNIYANRNDFKISAEDVEFKQVESDTYLGQLLTKSILYVESSSLEPSSLVFRAFEPRAFEPCILSLEPSSPQASSF